MIESTTWPCGSEGWSAPTAHGPEMKGAAVLYLKGDGSLTFYGDDGAVLDRFPARP
ncbi:MAG: hypothetical protein OEU54_04530 [Gemmatimonadota bacterium]|nr:hypothetical protein [Gemmatimonadota bacterium]